MKKNFWKSKNVLVTGFEGFVGSNLTKQLLSRDAHVVGLDIKIHRKGTILDKTDYNNMVVVKGSVCNYGLVKKLIDRYKVEVVFHLAAESLVGDCQKDPARALSTNIRGTWSVLEACRHSSSITSIAVASSDKAYGNQDVLPYRENMPLQGKHPYDVSKSCADLIAYTYYHTYGVPVAITRCGNIFGPGDFNFSRLVPDTIRCVLTGKMLLIRSDGMFTRDYIYVDDVINGYMILAEKLKKFKLAGEAFNFSNQSPIVAKELVDRIFKLACKKPNYRILNIAKYEIKQQYLSSRKARKILSWKPRVNLETGLLRTIEWYKRMQKD